MKEMDVLNKHLFLTAKPMIYLLNMAKKDYIKKKSKWLMPIKKKVNKRLTNNSIKIFYFQIDEVDPGATAILYSAQYELEYLDADEDTKKTMADEAPSQLEKIITNGYKGLGLEYFFTAGHDEVRVSKI